MSKTLREIEKEVILNAFEANKRNKTHTARALGIGIRTLQRKLKKYAAESAVLAVSVSEGQAYSEAKPRTERELASAHHVS